MNQNQKKYLQKRIDEITVAHRNSIVASEPKCPTLRQLFDAGKIKLRPIEKIVDAFHSSGGLYSYNSFNNIELNKVFDGVVDAYDAHKKAVSAAKRAVLDRTAKLESYALQLKDSVVFGSDKVALDTIKKFEKMKF